MNTYVYIIGGGKAKGRCCCKGGAGGGGKTKGRCGSQGQGILCVCA